MVDKKILMGCSNYWTSPFQVGSHHIVKGFVQLGWDVGFVSDPLSPLHILTGFNKQLSERLKIYRSGGIVDPSEKIWAYVPGAMFSPHNKPFLRSSWLAHHWDQLSFPSVIKQIEKNGFGEVDILYLDSPYHLYLLDKLKYKKSIYRIADKSSGFSKSTHSMKLVEKEIASRVDLVVYTARGLRNYVESLSPKQAKFFPNGVNYHHFANNISQTPLEYKKIKHPIALYVGAMADWFDFELVNETIKKLPNISFVFIGPDRLARQKLVNCSNVHILGPRNYSDLPAYMQHADVGIIPFDTKKHGELVHSINPLKLYEYMASGLPVVATEWDELLTLKSPAILCKDIDEFIAGINMVCNEGIQNRESLQDYAKKFDWNKKIENLL